MKQTIKQQIVEHLRFSREPLALHEFPYLGVNQCSLKTRLWELEESDIVVCRKRKDKPFSEFYLVVRRKEFEGQMGLGI